MLVQVYDLQHSGLLLLKGDLSVARMCETEPAASRGAREGAASYLAYYHACASGGILSFKFSTGV